MYTYIHIYVCIYIYIYMCGGEIKPPGNAKCAPIRYMLCCFI